MLRNVQMFRGYYKLGFALLFGLMLAGCSKPSAEPVAAKAVLPPPTAARPGTTFSASPNPIVSTDTSHLGETSITWSTTVAHAEVHIDSPGGRLFSAGGSKGTAPTGKWVRDGMQFYLQDATAPDPKAASATLASLIVSVQ